MIRSEIDKITLDHINAVNSIHIYSICKTSKQFYMYPKKISTYLLKSELKLKLK